MKRISLIGTTMAIIGLLWSSVSAAEEVPVFRAYVRLDKVQLFGLAIGDGRVEWLREGGEFSGYRVGSYDEKRETLTLVAGSKQIEIKIVSDAKVKNAKAGDEAHRLVNAIIDDIETATKRYVAYRSLPPDARNAFEGKPIAEGLHSRGEWIRRQGGLMHVVVREDGLPVVFSALPLDFERLPKWVEASLTTESKEALNRRYMTVSLQHNYVVYLAHAAAGNVQRQESPGENRELKLGTESFRRDQK